MQRLSKSWWLFALCAVLDGAISWLFFRQSEHGVYSIRDVLLLARIMTAAGICTMAVAIWAKSIEAWLLALNGVACTVLGLILSLWRGPVQFRTIALLVVVMAVSMGVYELTRAHHLRSKQQIAAGWLFELAGAVALGFALVFLGFALQWIRLTPGEPGQSLDWLGSFFALTAVSMLGLVLQPGLRSGPGETLPAFGTPRPAH